MHNVMFIFWWAPPLNKQTNWKLIEIWTENIIWCMNRVCKQQQKESQIVKEGQSQISNCDNYENKFDLNWIIARLVSIWLMCITHTRIKSFHQTVHILFLFWYHWLICLLCATHLSQMISGSFQLQFGCPIIDIYFRNNICCHFQLAKFTK